MSTQLSQTLPWLGRKLNVRIAIVGDIILDEYLDGSVNRISPEAPVPVHLVQRSFRSAGGAANVARNVKLAGGDVLLLSVCGTDSTAESLRKILQQDDINTEGLIGVSDRPTVKKTRVSANNHQIVRIDWEKVHPISADEQEKILAILRKQSFDALVISDYGKGTLPVGFVADLLALAAKRKVPSLVDPKGKDYSRYLHASYVTPNRQEACEALGLDTNEHWTGQDLGRKLQSTYGLSHVVVTMGPKGMVYVPDPDQDDKNSLHIPAQAREVYDVSGAGDTVIALLALGIASGAPVENALRIANLGAGLVVEKWGTQPIYRHELEDALNSGHVALNSPRSSSKIMSPQQAQSQIGDKAHRRKKVVFTNGCFDLMHAGHATYLEVAKTKGDVLVVGLNDDESIRRLKGPGRPIQSLKERAKLLASLESVDIVIPFSEDTPLTLIECLDPDILVKGADYKPQDIVGAEHVRKRGGAVETIELIEGLSTSELIRRIRQLPKS